MFAALRLVCILYNSTTFLQDWDITYSGIWLKTVSFCKFSWLVETSRSVGSFFHLTPWWNALSLKFKWNSTLIYNSVLPFCFNLFQLFTFIIQSKPKHAFFSVTVIEVCCISLRNSQSLSPSFLGLDTLFLFLFAFLSRAIF